MRLRTPAFWYKPPGPVAFLLWPLSCLYALSHRFHQSLGVSYRPPVKVVCIGNLVAGGSGKTPVALAVMNLIRKHELARQPFFLTRGYGGTSKDPFLLDPDRHAVQKTGDEALLLARIAPTVVAPRRDEGAKLAEHHGAGLILMDDGLHHPSLHKDIKFVVIDSAAAFGNGMMLPAGPLRTSLSQGLDLADAFVVIGPHPVPLPPGKPVFRASLQTAWNPSPGMKYIAFCGLGMPEKFFRFLEARGASLILKRAFPDHIAFSEGNLKRLLDESTKRGARLITTEKDAQRLPERFKANADVVPVFIAWENEGELVDFLKRNLDRPA